MTSRSIYSKTYNEKDGLYWTKKRKDNVLFLHMHQNYFNDLLRSRQIIVNGQVIRRGHLFLNEVFEKIGLPKTKEGQFVGWVYDENNPVGDNFVDFGINPRGSHPNVILDFNVDGYILDMNIF